MGLRSVNKRGRDLRHGIQDLEGLIEGGMKSPLAAQFTGAMNSSITLLRQAIHHKNPPDPDADQLTENTLVLYRTFLDDEAIGRGARLSGLPDEAVVAGLQDGTFDPFSEDLVREGFDGDPTVVDLLLSSDYD
jgi:hypothetical protein